MKPRHLAQHRLARRVPGERRVAPRPLVARLEDRAQAPDGSDLAERRVELWDHHPVPLKPFKIPQLGTPTPLLKRLVRHPISMEPGESRRHTVFDAQRPGPADRQRPSVAEAMRFTRCARRRPTLVPLGPPPRSFPFHRCREAALEREEAP